MLQTRIENRFPFPASNVDAPSVHETSEDKLEDVLELLDKLNGFELKRIKELFDNLYEKAAHKDSNYQVHNFLDNYLYIVYYPNGDRHLVTKGADAYRNYLDEGIRLERKTKDLFPIYETLLEKEYVEPVRKNQKPKEQIQKIEKAKYDMEYQKDNIKQVKFILNKNTDQDIIDYLQSKDNKNGYLKELIRRDMKNGN